jgi:hypothetical protein
MLGKTINPKSDLIGQASERSTVFARLALRERSENHPMVMFAAIVSAAFVWTLMPGETTVSAASAGAPVKEIREATTTAKTSRLPLSAVDRACEGQSWGGESLACVTMIARESGKADFKVRMIADAAPADLNTPNIF